MDQEGIEMKLDKLAAIEHLVDNAELHGNVEIWTHDIRAILDSE